MILLAELNPTEIINWLQRGGVLALLVIIIFGGYKKWWVFGWQFQDLESRISYLENANAKWMELAFKSTKISEEVTMLMRDSAGNDPRH